METKVIKFSLEQDYSVKAMAQYLAQLEREGVTYAIDQNGPSIKVKLTRGF